MREIKFRAWDEINHRMRQVSELNLNNGYVWCPTDSLPICLHDGLFKLMQYTGLKDKNGKEIYEGDIVQYNGEYFKEIAGVVWYGTGSWGLHDREKDLDELIFSQVIRYDSFSGKPIYTETEVIGNIYENPELLENLE